MASLQRKGDNWHCQFASQGKRHTFALGRVTRAEAEAKACYELRSAKIGAARWSISMPKATKCQPLGVVASRS